jgi:hypothetical protein
MATQFSQIVDSAAGRPQEKIRLSTLGHQEAFDQLWEVWNECRQANWDGYRALPVSQDAYRHAYLFVESLPVGFPAPTFGAEPSGAITLEWYRSQRRLLSVSVTGDGEVFYAALFGTNRVHGREDPLGGVPKILLNLIQRVYSA